MFYSRINKIYLKLEIKLIVTKMSSPDPLSLLPNARASWGFLGDCPSSENNRGFSKHFNPWNDKELLLSPDKGSKSPGWRMLLNSPIGNPPHSTAITCLQARATSPSSQQFPQIMFLSRIPTQVPPCGWEGHGVTPKLAFLVPVIKPSPSASCSDHGFHSLQVAFPLQSVQLSP